MPERNELGQRVGHVVEPAWSPRPRPEAAELVGRYVVLEPLADGHAPDLHATLCGPHDAALWTYRPVGPPGTTGELAALNRGWPWNGGNVSWAVLPTAAGAPAGTPAGTASGMTTFTRIEPAHGQVEIAGVVYSTALQRTAATTESTHLLMRYAFDTLGYRRVEWKCDSLNEPSRRAATRLGFTFEGTFRHHMVTRGRNRDTAWFSVTDHEWRTLRAVHERWLAPDNFSDGGRQRLALGALTAAWRDTPTVR
ncbi:MAG: GNAT family N-acetyltransferase [Phycicoccus sp.]